MTIYAPSIESDLLLLDWYTQMGQTEDFERTFSVEFAPCSAFLAGMQRSLLVYEADEHGIWFAAWFDRVMCGGAFGLWVRAGKRQSREALRVLLAALDLGLAHFPVLLFVTRDATVRAQGERLGFQTLGDIPWFFDGETASVAWMDRVHYEAATKTLREPIEPLPTETHLDG